MTRSIDDASAVNMPSHAVRNSAFRMTLHSEIEIAASPKQVWSVLADFSAYREWNPCIPSAEGEATPGTMLHVVIHWPGLKRSNYDLEVLAATPERELRWLGHFGRKGLLDGDHSFIIERAGEDRSQVSQTETFSGLLVPPFAPWLRNNILKGFDLMNAALLGRLESGSSVPSTS